MGTILLVFYNLLTPVIALLYLFFFFLSPRRRLLKNLVRELGERFFIARDGLPTGAVWLHAASVGEVKALRKVISTLREKSHGLSVIITTSTWAGRMEAFKLTPYARLLPLDFYPLMRAFIAAAKPRLLIIAETEIWPNMICCAAAAGVRTCIINGRLSAKTLFLYRVLSPFSARIFSGVEKVLAQSPADAARYELLMPETSAVVCTGNIKYDLLDAGLDKLSEIRSVLDRILWTDALIWTAASTHRGEEEVLVDSYLALKKSYPGLKLVIAPRHPERAGETKSLLASRNVDFSVWSGRGASSGAADCLLVDEMGWLAGFFSLSVAVFVGGTLVKVGGHNLLEPAVFSKPVLFGPNVRSTREAAEMLIKTGGGSMVADQEQICARMDALLKDPQLLRTTGENAKKALENLQGATARTFSVIEKYL